RASKKDFKGTGIGLSIVARIIEKHNGKIWIESEPGKGSTFFFYL
ncbi:MAG: ATP-binding protein, partial [Salegentibacter mishustinae]|nr:ATP-binding protein [Salegentibacter mishustinae]